MRKSIPLSITLTLMFNSLLILSLAHASESINFSFVSQAKTPVEQALQTPELTVTGLGLGGYKAQLNKRLDYAKDRSWLSAKQLDGFKTQIQLIQQKENNLRDAGGCLSFERQQELLKDLILVNDSFENAVLNREQAIQERETLIARQNLIYQAIERGLRTKKLSTKQAQEYRAQLDNFNSYLKNQELAQETTHQLDNELTQLKYNVEKELKNKRIAKKHSPHLLAAKVKHTPIY